MKNPNGYGCIKLLSGSRRRPYCFVVSQQGKQKVIGYFELAILLSAFKHGLYADCYPVESGVIIAIVIHRGSEFGSGKISFYAKVTL